MLPRDVLGTRNWPQRSGAKVPAAHSRLRRGSTTITSGKLNGYGLVGIRATCDADHLHAVRGGVRVKMARWRSEYANGPARLLTLVQVQAWPPILLWQVASPGSDGARAVGNSGRAN